MKEALTLENFFPIFDISTGMSTLMPLLLFDKKWQVIVRGSWWSPPAALIAFLIALIAIATNRPPFGAPAIDHPALNGSDDWSSTSGIMDAFPLSGERQFFWFFNEFDRGVSIELVRMCRAALKRAEPIWKMVALLEQTIWSSLLAQIMA